MLAPSPRRSFLDTCLSFVRRHPAASATAVVSGLLAVSALVNAGLARKAERDNPPEGSFIDIDGVHLHYVERGTGRPLVLFHGNGSMIQDFESSGLIDLAAAKYRVIVFDRPGFGHSSRPRNVIWTAAAQADLFAKALASLGIANAIVLGHSWGTLVAVALAAGHPSMVQALVLASGYYFPTLRADVVAMSGLAVPGVGDIMSYTVSPILGRVTWPATLNKLFGPRSVPGKFSRFPREMALRPSQLRAAAAETELMVPAAFTASKSYDDLTMPVVIIAGENDRVIDIGEQSNRLHGEIKQSSLHRVAGAGHMLHQSDTADLMAAIDEAAEMSRQNAGAREQPRRQLAR